MKKYLFIGMALISFKAFNQVTQPAGTGTLNVNSCGIAYEDNGGAAANYANNCNSVVTICPTVPGQYVTVTFVTFSCQTGFDILYVFDGGVGGAPLASLTGTTVPAAITSSDPGGCLTFHFVSNGSTTRPGWTANITCSVAPGAGGANSPQDCGGGGGTTVCGTTTITGNSSGIGAAELSSTWDGCLTGEHQSSWYYFSPSAGGTVAFTISPANGTDDYDFAIWGPSGTDVPCPFGTGLPPLRCSYAAGGGNTGLLAGAGDNTEGAAGNKFVEPINVNAGEIYCLLIDNFTSSASPFDLVWNLTGGAALDCTSLPIELLGFYAYAKDQVVQLDWATASEINNDYFTIERSKDGENWQDILQTAGAGASNSTINYSEIDSSPLYGTSYYRLKQTDFNGAFSYSTTQVVKFGISNDAEILSFPNPNDGSSFNLEFTGFGNEEVLVVVRDIQGKEFYSKAYLVSDKNSIFAITTDTKLPAGVYFVTASSNDIFISKKINVK